MAKKMKRFLALALALILCAGQLATVSVAAELEDENQPQITVTPIENGTQTVTVTSQTTEDHGIVENVEITTTEISQSVTETVPAGTTDENGFTSQGGNQTTEVESSEEKTVVDINNGPEYPLFESEKIEGEETTTVTTTETKTKETTETPAITTTDNAYVPDETADTDTGWVQNSGEAGEDTYEDAVITQDPGDVELNMTQKDRKDQQTIYLDLEKVVQENIDLPAEGVTRQENADGSVVETDVEYIYDGQTVIGYTITRTTSYTEVHEDKEYTRGETTAHTDEDQKTEEKDDTIFVLPTRPEDSRVEHEDGSVSVSKVEDILDENNEVIGYKTVTVTTAADGTVTSSYQNIYGTKIKTHTETTTTDTTVTESTELTKDKVTTETHIRFQDAEGYELVWDRDRWVYAAELGKVKEGNDHGDVNIAPLTPTSLVLNGKKYVVNRSDSTVVPVGNHNSPEGYDYNYTGVRGEGSNFAVKTSNYYDSDAHMFQMKIGKDTFYVYCVDFSTTATPNYNYKIENVADATYYDEEASRHIQAIGTYGYWGTTGVDDNGDPVKGSLEALKETLTAARKAAGGKNFPLTEKQIKNLTEGEALTATQAAFWTYGNSGYTTIDAAQANDTITGLYQWLISQEAPVTESTDMIEKDEFAQEASVTVKEKATNADGSVKTEGGRTVYNTDVSFTIDVTQSSLTGNLEVSLVQNGKTVKKVQLSTADSNVLGKIMAGGKEVGTSVSFKDVELIEGVKFTINLDGTQELEEGVYIYTSEKINDKPSQTFVGLAAGEHTVDLAVDMTFTVSEPEVQVKDPGALPGQTRVQTETERKHDTETVVTKLQKIEISTVEIEKTEREWGSYTEKTYTYESDPEPYNDENEIDEKQTPEIEIPDEEVPLGAAPETGDISGLWIALSGISAAGMLLLSRKRRDEE